jgi:hypothetical protein
MEKTLLILPSNLQYAPYAAHYLDVLISQPNEYEVLYWDRFNLNENSIWIRYEDKKIGHQRSFLDYIKFFNFAKKICRKNNYKKIIVFGVQLAFFFSNFLKENYKGRYVCDVRDYHILSNLFNFNDFIKSANFVAISSPGFLDWLPQSSNYKICHNLPNNFSKITSLTEISTEKPLIISYIGSLRDYHLHSSFANEISNSNNLYLKFHGDGTINKSLKIFLAKNKIKNAAVENKYHPDDEFTLYQRSSIINSLIPTSGINNTTLLPNRLYRSALSKRPLLSLKGTKTSNIIHKHQIGLVLEKISGCEDHIIKYMNNLDTDKLSINCENFISESAAENAKFRQHLINFLN